MCALARLTDVLKGKGWECLEVGSYGLQRLTLDLNLRCPSAPGRSYQHSVPAAPECRCQLEDLVQLRLLAEPGILQGIAQGATFIFCV